MGEVRRGRRGGAAKERGGCGKGGEEGAVMWEGEERGGKWEAGFLNPAS